MLPAVKYYQTSPSSHSLTAVNKPRRSRLQLGLDSYSCKKSLGTCHVPVRHRKYNLRSVWMSGGEAPCSTGSRCWMVRRWCWCGCLCAGWRDSRVGGVRQLCSGVLLLRNWRWRTGQSRPAQSIQTAVQSTLLPERPEAGARWGTQHATGRVEVHPNTHTHRTIWPVQTTSL